MARRREANGRNNREARRPRRRWYDELQPETKQSILAIAFFVGALITLLAYWGRAGSLGRLIAKALGLAVGSAYFIVPVTFLIVTFSLLASFRRRIVASSLIGGTLFALSALALIDLFFAPKTAGWIGFIANWPLERALDVWGAFVIEAALLAVSMLLAANVPLWWRREAEPASAREATANNGPEAGKIAGAMTAAVSAAKDAVGNMQQRLPERKDEPRPSGRSPEEEEFTVARQRMRRTAYVFPPLDLLKDDRGTPSSGDIRANANIIRRTLLNFGIDVEMGEVSIGPTVTQYTLKPAEGVKLSRIIALQNDLSLALAAHPIRIEAPIPGKSLVGIEVPNHSIALVGLQSLLSNEAFRNSSAPLLFALGRDVAGAPVYANLSRMPHLLVAGATGSGKSVLLHSMITAFLYRNPPELLKFLVIDPKRVELAIYAGIPHLLTPPITDPKKTIIALRWAVKEMERRYEVLSAAGARDLSSYNDQLLKRNARSEDIVPYLVIVIDELADLIFSFPREVEASIVRLAQMARAVGMHLVVSTQRPSVEVITGLIKANITSRLAFQVASQVDSRTILDAAGAEKLLGNGDMLFLAGDTAKPRRIQGGFVSEEEVRKITEFIVEHNEATADQAVESEILEPRIGTGDGEGLEGEEAFEGDDDPLYEEAKDTVIKAGKASASYLQRRLKIGYARAARLLDLMEERGVIGPGEGAKPREIFIKAGGVNSTEDTAPEE